MQTEQFKIATYNVNSVRVRMPIILDWLAREQPEGTLFAGDQGTGP